MNKGTFTICTDLGNGISTFTPYGFTVDVSAEVKRWEVYRRKLLRAYFRKKGIRAPK
jgi:hypothetical protein